MLQKQRAETRLHIEVPVPFHASFDISVHFLQRQMDVLELSHFSLRADLIVQDSVPTGTPQPLDFLHGSILLRLEYLEQLPECTDVQIPRLSTTVFVCA